MNLESIRSYPIKELESLPPLTDLQRALLRAGVKILDADDVKAYQAQKLAQKLEESRANPLRLWRGRLLVWAIAATIACSVVLLFGGSWQSWVAAVSIVGSICRVRYKWETFAVRILPGWRNYCIGDIDYGQAHVSGRFQAPGVPYDTGVPAEGLAICERLAEAGATCQIRVEQLDEDPFLLAVSDESYYLFAWDEAGFIPRP